MTKRDFLKLLAGSLGGALLSSCGDGGGGLPGGPSGPGEVPDLPIGYRFYRVKSAGEAVGAGGAIDYFHGTAHLGNQGQLTFHSRGADERVGLHQLTVDWSGSQPSLVDERTAVIEGQTLVDGRIVGRMNAVDTNASGGLAVTVLAGNEGPQPEHVLEGLYQEVGGSLVPVVVGGTALGDGSTVATGGFGDIDLHDDGNLLVVAHHTPAEAGGRAGQGLFYVAGAAAPAARLLMSTGDPVPDGDSLVSGIGLVDLNDGGNYVAQVYDALPLNAGSRAMPDGGTVLLGGNVRAAGDARALAASSPATASRQRGETVYGPRLGPSGLVAHILTLGGEVQALVYGSQIALTCGDPSPAGGEVLGIGPGAFGADGLYYYTLYSNSVAGMELAVFNGREHRVLLSRGDALSDGGSPVETILFGTTTEHVDAQGNLAFVCEFADGSSALVVGTPA